MDAINYIQEYYFESKNGMYYFYDVENDDFEFKTRDNFKNEVLDKVDNCKITSKIIKINYKIYKIVSDIFKPRHYKIGKKYYINVCKGFLHKKYKQFDDYSNEIKENVNLYISYLKEIMCNGDDIMLDAYLKYYAQMAKGIKTEVIIYRKSGEGWGKSTETDFIFNYVFGKNICLISGTEPLTSNYNKIYMGKLLVIFEELPTFSDAQWKGVSSKLKTLTTEKVTTYRDLYEKAVQADNISNFQINTNVESIQNSDGRRYIILDLNPSRIRDYEYFRNLRNNCFNNEVGEAFFSYLMTKVKITDEQGKDFMAQEDFPETSNKRLAIANLLHSSYKFLKERYLLTKTSIQKVTPTELYLEYKLFCQSENYKSCGRNDFYKKLEFIQIFSKFSNGDKYYNVDIKTLRDIAKKNMWVCEYDDYQESDDEKNEDEEEDDEEIIDYKALYEALLQENKNKDGKDYEVLLGKFEMENDTLKYQNKKLKKKLKKLSEKEEEEKEEAKEEANIEIDNRNAIFGFDKKKEDETTHNPFNCIRKKK